MEIDSGASDDNEEDDTIVEKPGRRRDALAACHWQTLQQYIADINNPFACQLEALLSRFGRQTSLEETQSLQQIISRLINT